MLKTDTRCGQLELSTQLWEVPPVGVAEVKIVVGCGVVGCGVVVRTVVGRGVVVRAVVGLGVVVVDVVVVVVDARTVVGDSDDAQKTHTTVK